MTAPVSTLVIPTDPPRPAARLTDQQRVAVTRREVSIVLSSGAGCGKTHVLTERYLSHLRDDGAEVSQVVAITFTDRAARQMRDRIRRAVLQELRSAHSDKDVELWSRHLRGLETAQISTIHAFCGTLLRQHAIDAGLDPRFDVLDDVMAANLRGEAYADALQELLVSAATAGDDLRELILLYGWRPTVAAVEHLVAAHDGPAWDAWLARPADEVARQWFEDERRDLLPRYVDYLVAACPKVTRCLGLLKKTPCLKPQTSANVRRILEETPRLAEAPDLAAAVAGLVESAKVSNSKEKASAWASEDVYESVKEAFEGYRKDLAERTELFTQTPDGVADAVAVGRRFLRVAAEAARAYGRRKRRAGALDFQDLLTTARDLLRGRDDVREALQRRYRFLLVDELQDTDPVQMEVVESLCGGGLTTGKLFGVGDFKQSIYRFRGADVRLFQRLRHGMAHEGRLGLTVNFRSQPAVLDFVNALFARRVADYEPLQAHHAQVNPGPCVEFLWSSRFAKENVAEARAREADAIARRVAGMVGGERLVADHAAGTLRPVRPGDVVLLFRSMSNVALYEAALRRHGLDYYLVGGRAFFAQQEIYDVLNLLRALENPKDDVSLVGVLRSPFCCLSDEALVLVGRHRDGVWAGLHDDALAEQLPDDQRPAAARARRDLDRWRSLKDRLPIARLLGEVLADSGYDGAVQFEFLGDRKLANLWKLLEMARAFDRGGLFGLAEFIQRLGDLVSSQPREEQAATQPESADVVRLMTIHQAKGLEFPVVILPDLAARTGGGGQPVALWDARLGCVARPPADEDPAPFPDFGHRLWRAHEAVDEWHEDLRTLYVACTRAQDYLVLSASLSESASPETPWMLALAERFDPRSGACLADDVPPDRVPRVRVTDLLAASLPSPTSSQGARVSDRARAPLLGKGEASVEPVPARVAGKRIFTVAELERFLKRPKGRGRSASPLRAADVARQFDREDGADRREWARPGDEFGAREEEASARPARDVLSVWDFRDPEGWRMLFAARGREDGAAAEEILARFAASPTRAALALARTRQRDVEFLLDVPAGGGLFGGSERVAVRGVIDCVWEDAAGGRHLLAFSAGAPATGRRAKGAIPLGLALAACAVRRQFGAWPADVRLYDLPTGKVVEVPGDDPGHEAALSAVADVVNDIQRQQIV